MKVIKVSAGAPEKTNLLLRQTINSMGILNDCKFVVNDSKLKKCDWWFVLHGSGLVETENCLCDPDQVVYVSMEPNEKISAASDKFLQQFSHLVICDRNIRHHNIIYNNWSTWWVGMTVSTKNKKHIFYPDVKFDYDQLSSMQPDKKINKISIILSDKDLTEGHKKRKNFINKIINLPISKHIDLYGHGFNPIPDKWDAIAPYKYHLILENSVQKDYWSEKLADAFLGFSFPIYYGCPNIYDYFSRDSLSIIDINSIDTSVKILQDIIEGNTYENSINSIGKSRNKVLNQFNIFNLMAKLAVNKSLKYQNVVLKTNMHFKDFFLKKIARFIISKFKN